MNSSIGVISVGKERGLCSGMWYLVILHVIYKREFRLPHWVPDFSHCGVQQDRETKQGHLYREIRNIG